MQIPCEYCHGKKGNYQPNHSGGLDFFPCGPCGGKGWRYVADPDPNRRSFGMNRPPPWAPPLEDPAFPLVGRWQIDGGCLDIFPLAGNAYPVKEWGEAVGQSGEGQAYGQGNQVQIELGGGPAGNRVYSLTFHSNDSLSGTSSMWGMGLPIALRR